MTPLLRVEDVSRHFGGFSALSNVSCEVAAGHIHALIGPNGAGKSTLFNIISGVLRPSRGRIVFDGGTYTGCRPDRISRMGIARNFQHVRLVRGLSVVENVMVGCHTGINRGLIGNLSQLFGVGNAERSARKRALEMIDLVGLADKLDIDPSGLTLADQRRLEIARALASGPRLLLLDEPAAGMNPTDVVELSALLKKIRSGGITLMLVEHHMRLIMSIADIVTVLSAGSVIAVGTPSVVQTHPDVVSAYLGQET
jgi:ABC-type branched-subunit amino acid transport system ATPase component